MTSRLSAPTTPDPMTAPPVHWGVIGPGYIAHSFTEAALVGTQSRVVAVGSRSAERASEFAQQYGIQRVHGSYADLVADPEVEAVYIATPHSEHREHALLALEAGKPVLVEKAFTRSLAEADEVLAAGAASRLLVAEAMWARYLPGYDVVRRSIVDGVLGDVVLVQADHCQLLWPDGPARLAEPGLAGGGLLDLGVYPLALADHLLGGISGVRADGTLSDKGVDVTVAMTAEGADGGLASLTCTMAAAGPCTATIIGTRGRIGIGGRFYSPMPITLFGPDGGVRDHWAPEHTAHGFRYQIAEFARALADGRTEPWSVPHAATRRVMAAMDAVRAQLGVVYPGE